MADARKDLEAGGGSRRRPAVKQKLTSTLYDELRFVRGVGDKERRARKLVREPEGSFTAPPAGAPDFIDRQLDEGDRWWTAFRDGFDRIAPGEAASNGGPSPELSAAIDAVRADIDAMRADAERRIREALRRRGIELHDASPVPAEQARRSGLVSVLRPFLTSGTFYGDVLRLDLSRGEVLDADRAAAVHRLADRFPKPVHRKRWWILWDALQREAGDRPTQDERLRHAVESVLALVASEVRRAPALDAPLLLRRLLNKLVTNDVCDPGWRRRREDDLDRLESDQVEPPPEVAAMLVQRWDDDERERLAAEEAAEAVAAELARVAAVATPTQRRQLARVLAVWRDHPDAGYWQAAELAGLTEDQRKKLLPRLRQRLGR